MKKILKTIERVLKDYNINQLTFRESDFLLVFNVEKDNLKDALKLLKENVDTQFTVLTDITAVDYPEKEKRFEVIYNLLSIKSNMRVLIKVQISDKEQIDSIFDIYSASVWYEREVWDMFGIKFEGSPDHRRILTDYGFLGYPLRKDFPLTGHKEVRYDLEQQKVIYEPVTLTQEFRNFDFVSPWEGPEYNNSDDNKTKR